MGPKPKATKKDSKAIVEEPKPFNEDEVPKKKMDVAKIHAALEKLNKNNVNF